MLGYINNLSQMRTKVTKRATPLKYTPIKTVDNSTEGQVKNLIANIQSMNIRS